MHRLVVLAFFSCVAASVVAAGGEPPPMHVVSPATTGIPGEEIRVVRWSPDHKLWVAARWPFWQDGGLAVYDELNNIWTTWSTIDYPIPSEYINDFEWAADGAMWLATDRGLVRWDGADWTIYNPINSPLRRFMVMNLSIAPNGHIWVNNSDYIQGGGTLFDFDGASTWVPYEVPDELPWDAPWYVLSDVLVSTDGRVWVGNETLNGLAEFDGDAWTLHAGIIGRVGGITEDTAGNIWMHAGVGGGNLYWKWNGSIARQFAMGSTPLTVAADDDGAVFLGDWYAVYKTTNGGNSWTTFRPDINHAYNLAPDPLSTDLWIGAIGAVGQYRANATWVRDFNTYNTGLPDYFIEYMMTDRDGNFWVASGEGGLSRFDGQRWRNWGAHNAGSEEYPFAGNEPMGGAYQDVNRIVWMGGNGIARWNPDTNEFSGFWNWENNPGMGVTLFPFFAEDMNHRLFAADEYGLVYHFDEQVQLWIREPVNVYAVLGLPGMKADHQGNVWVAGWFDVYKWDGAAWSTVTLPYPDYFFDLGGINGFEVDVDDTLWFGTEEGLVHWDGVDFILYTTQNTPLPTNAVKSVAIRSDGIMGISASYFQSNVPFPHGVCVVDGAIEDPASWTIYQYGSSPLPHYQLGRAAFDAGGDLWVSAVSEGCAVVDLAPPGSPADLDGDGDVDLADLSLLLVAFGSCDGDANYNAAADFDASGCVDLADLSTLLTQFGI